MAKILLVEDDKSLREIYGVRLMAEGYTITSAGDGEEALAVAIKERPDLIVSDVMMPKISGFDMLDILRSTTETKDIKVIMMTALSSEDQRARGEALGADRYLVKSQVGIEDVVRTVHDVLGDNIVAAAPAAPVFPPAAAPVVEAPAPIAPEPIAQPAPAPVAEPVAYAAPAPVAPVAPEPVAPAPEPVVAPAPVAPFAVEPPVATPVQSFDIPAPAPVQPAPEPVYTAPVPEPTPVVAPVAPAPAPFPPASTLPEPTAPFSSPRPASLGDRVINPLPSADSLNPGVADLATQMNQELNAQLQQVAPQPQAIAPPPVPPTPPVQPLPPQPGL